MQFSSPLNTLDFRAPLDFILDGAACPYTCFLFCPLFLFPCLSARRWMLVWLRSHTWHWIFSLHIAFLPLCCSPSKTAKDLSMELWSFLCRFPAGNNSQVFHLQLDPRVTAFLVNVINHFYYCSDSLLIFNVIHHRYTTTEGWSHLLKYLDIIQVTNLKRFLYPEN